MHCKYSITHYNKEVLATFAGAFALAVRNDNSRSLLPRLTIMFHALIPSLFGDSVRALRLFYIFLIYFMLGEKSFNEKVFTNTSPLSSSLFNFVVLCVIGLFETTMFIELKYHYYCSPTSMTPTATLCSVWTLTELMTVSSSTSADFVLDSAPPPPPPSATPSVPCSDIPPPSPPPS